MNEKLSDYLLSSMGKISVHIDEIRAFVIKELKETKDHTKICRAYEGMTGKLVINHHDTDEDMKWVKN